MFTLQPMMALVMKNFIDIIKKLCYNIIIKLREVGVI